MSEAFASSNYREAKGKAFELLARREHSCAELRTKLCQKGVDQDIVDSLLDELISLQYLSDERYAAMIVRSGYDRGHGPNKIKQKLFHSGVSSTLIADAFQENDQDWFQLAKNVRHKKFKNNLNITCSASDRQTYMKEKTRQMRFLASRGFTIDQIEYAFTSEDD